MSDIESKLRGVNLGGWLVLERWITPSVFRGTMAQDEYSLCKELGDAKFERLQEHRKAFITADDFAWIKDQGLNAVRIPVPYWIFDGAEPFVAGTEYLDFAFEQCRQQRLSVILSVHAVPGSQNGQDHSGRAGAVAWHKDANNIEQTLSFIEKLAERYSKNGVLVGIEVLNEPAKAIPATVLTSYYQRAKQIIERLAPGVHMIVSDQFNYLEKVHIDDIWADTHMYQAFNWLDRRRAMHAVLKHAKNNWKRYLQDLGGKYPVIVGEWSLVTHQKAMRGLDEYERDKALQAYGRIQLETFAEAEGWFYWTYKTEDSGAWNFRDCVQRGWIDLRGKITS